MGYMPVKVYKSYKESCARTSSIFVDLTKTIMGRGLSFSSEKKVFILAVGRAGKRVSCIILDLERSRTDVQRILKVGKVCIRHRKRSPKPKITAFDKRILLRKAHTCEFLHFSSVISMFRF